VFLDYLTSGQRFSKAVGALRRGTSLYAPSFYAPYVLAGLIRSAGAPGWLVVVPDAEQAARLAGDLAVYLERDVETLPARGVLYGADVAPAAHVLGQRQRALGALEEGDGVVVADAVALLERFIPLTLQPRPLRLEKGAEVAFDDVLAGLASLGYERAEQVRERGEFAVRGGLVDVYPSTGDPVRAEFWGDTVESLRRFSVFSQRTVAEAETCLITTAVEVDPTGEAVQAAVSQELSSWELAGHDETPDEAYRRAETRALVRLADRFVDLAAVCEGRGVRLASVGPDDVVRSLAGFDGELAAALPGELRERFYLPLLETRRLLSDAVAVELVQREQRVQFHAARPQAAGRDITAAERDLRRLADDGYRVFVVFRHPGEASRAGYRMKSLVVTQLEPAELREDGAGPDGAAPRGAASAARAGAAAGRPVGGAARAALDPGIYFVAAPLREGFISSELKLAVIGEHSLLRAAPSGPRFVGGARLTSFFDLRANDYVVHEDHGIALFSGIETRTVAGVTRDYLFLRFKEEDKLFVPHDQIGKVTRYIGASGAAPPLNRLGGAAWQAVKTRARKAVAEMAGQLLTLYAARQAVPGHAFAGDGELTRRLEDGFAYEETDDQAEAIDDVKNDMEAPHPMDRLICGDVGYGKTEVALRAALKAAEGGKQTLMLVPTTILAEQHYLTFAERFEELPVTVQMVSRFRTAAEQRRILAEFAAGKVDVLIGTHRLLSRDVVPRDLGLVIVDEEQRFGVRQKELLRQLKLQVDVVSLSATPIPRTLQMSLTGIRDISVIETPPRGRHEVRTYIGEYRDDLVRAAIEKEVARDGQVFYLHNRVETIDRAAEQVRDLVPDARIAVGHGQMHERQLEKVMLGFLAGEADVLVSTSIIESGIDVPTANTLIVERADLLGLAQLYQIRGRIGRSDQYAYAYLLYPSEEYLTDDAAARLRTLSDYTELGSGFKIAMRDLEIRGAGNLLGDEQSGQVAAVGFEMYAQLLEEAVADLRGEPPATLPPVRLEIPVTAYVPPDYIAYEATKIDAHRRIAQAGDLRALDEVRAELTDRFGAPPEPVENLLVLQSIRLRAAALGASAAVYRAGRLQIEGLELADDWAAAVRASDEGYTYFKQKRVLSAHKRDDGAAILAWVGVVLDDIIGAREP
jgi:transcription-repair coupling factor (superfamily II helicase)